MNRTLGVAALALALLVPAPALAHAHLKRSDPAAGSRLTSPQVIRLWFSEAPEISMTFAALKDSSGNPYALGSAERERSGQMGIAFPVLRPLPPGRYTMTWRTAASDGHPSSGKFTFVVVAPPTIAGATGAPGTPTESIDSAMPPTGMTMPGMESSSHRMDPSPPVEDVDAASSIGNSVARALLFVALLALIGTVAFQWLVLPRARTLSIGLKQRMSRRAATLGAVSALLVIVVALLRLHLESQMMNAMPDMPGMQGMSVRGMVMQTDWGVGFRIQLAAAVAAFVGFTLAVRRVRGAWLVAGASAVVLAITPALGGHAAASPRFTSLMIASDWLHVLGGASWLGSLLCVMAIGVPIALKLDPPTRWSSVASLVNAFSPIALVSAGVVVASGLFASWVHLEHLAALWQTSYGQALLAKLFLVAITFGIGAYNFKRVQPQLSGQTGTERLRKSAVVELGTGFLILLVTGLLTGISP